MKYKKVFLNLTLLFLFFSCVNSEPTTDIQINWCEEQYEVLISQILIDKELGPQYPNSELSLLREKAYRSTKRTIFPGNPEGDIFVTEAYNISNEEYSKIINLIEDNNPKLKQISITDFYDIYEFDGENINLNLFNENYGHTNWRAGLREDAFSPFIYELNFRFEKEMLSLNNEFSLLHCKVWEEITN